MHLRKSTHALTLDLNLDISQDLCGGVINHLVIDRKTGRQPPSRGIAPSRDMATVTAPRLYPMEVSSRAWSQFSFPICHTPFQSWVITFFLRRLRKNAQGPQIRLHTCVFGLHSRSPGSDHIQSPPWSLYHAIYVTAGSALYRQCLVRHDLSTAARKRRVM
jgi:hypothetical protein